MQDQTNKRCDLAGGACSWAEGWARGTGAALNLKHGMLKQPERAAQKRGARWLEEIYPGLDCVNTKISSARCSTDAALFTQASTRVCDKYRRMWGDR